MILKIFTWKLSSVNLNDPQHRDPLNMAHLQNVEHLSINTLNKIHYGTITFNEPMISLSGWTSLFHLVSEETLNSAFVIIQCACNRTCNVNVM